MLGRSELLDPFKELDGLLVGDVTHELIDEGYWRGTVIADLEGFVGEVLEGLVAGAAELDAQYGAPEPPGLDI